MSLSLFIGDNPSEIRRVSPPTEQVYDGQQKKGGVQRPVASVSCAVLCVNFERVYLHRANSTGMKFGAPLAKSVDTFSADT